MSIIKFSNILNEAKMNKILYHGSPKSFKEFNNSLTFFSDTETFASDYADQKSFDYALDAEPRIYEVEVTTDIFDINDKKNYDELEKLLPDTVSYSYNNFGFEDEVSRDDILFNMTGYYKKAPYEKALNTKIGDVIEYDISMSQIENYVVYDVDSEYVYAYNRSTLFGALDVIRRRDKFDVPFHYKEYYKRYEPVVNFVEDYAKKDTDSKYLNNNTKQIYFIQFRNNEKNSPYGVDVIPQSEIEKFNKLDKECIDDIIKFMREKKTGIKQFNVVEQTLKLDDTWRYFENETVLNAIIKLGYGGYVAKESKVNTYAIFNPKESVKILKYYFPIGVFDSWDDWLKYYAQDKYVGSQLKEIGFKDWMWLDRHDIYNYYKKGFSKEDTLKGILKDIENKKKER